ncbi:chromosome segregation protein [Gimesia panareensis]|uniref:Chromosome segregation protein n=1 Tax=Gimesia panareensis TaxID=2527978 RepID=A0A518FY17_9PLAN|nr:AAA family ATPase [Gimesia panareensis]QDV21269.1 chromosome segregation protein [Gimesia panareensis]
MRLRYLHLPNYGILKDLKVHFDKELLFSQPGELYRKGDLHFVVGLNGTGKSSLLRAIYETFRWLEGISNRTVDSRLTFPFPVTLIYDLPSSSQVEYERTCFFHHSGISNSDGFFFIRRAPVEEDEHGTWDDWIEWLKESLAPDQNERLSSLVRADKLQGDQRLQNSLPSPMLVYTSGSLAIWNRVREPDLPLEDLAETTYDMLFEERPRGWDAHQELALTDVEIAESARASLLEFLDPNVSAVDSKCRLLDPIDLKLAAAAVGLTVFAGEAIRLQDAKERKTYRDELIQQVEDQRKGARPDDKSARTLLNEVDWWFPTHLSFQYRPLEAKLNPEWHAQLLVMCALADEVIRQPLERMQLIINLGPRTISVRDEIETVYGKRDIPVEVDEVINRVDGSTSGAQAVLRTLCTEEQTRYETDVEPEFARWPVFDRLQSWRQAKLIEDLSLTIKRVTQMQASDGKLDDVVVTWEDLSDGEQMLLGRMALLLLLSKQDGSLLLLDEPETHFNDSWKREIIDLVDDNILRSTFSHVVVATHTSIALTDAFADEIIRLIRSDGKAIFKPVSFSTFGADVGRVMLHVFDTPESIGSRANEILDRLLNYTWTSENIDLLEHVVSVVGGGWPRAKLREILEVMRASSNT